MAIVQVLLAAIAKQTGKLLNTAFGWASVLLFGKVSADRQLYLSLISFGSVLWLLTALSIVFPRVGAFLLAFIVLPDWVHPNWIRLAMLGAALIIPLGVGFISTRLARDADGALHGGMVKTIFRGYPVTLGLALTLVILMAFAPIHRLRQLVRRWSTAHIPMIVEAHEYLTVVQQIQDALAHDGMRTRRTHASWMIRFPTKILTTLAGGTVHNLVADELTLLVSSSLEVLLHPADLVISGPEQDVDATRALLAERMMFTSANLTWTEEANQLEDRLNTLWREMATEAEDELVRTVPPRLAAITHDIRTAKLSFDEWQILNRYVLAIDRAVLAVAAKAIDHPQELLSEQEGLASLTIHRHADRTERRFVRALGAAAVLGVALVARKIPESKEVLSQSDLYNLARLGDRISADRN